VLEAATREAAATLARRAGLPPERLVLGGRSMGGRYCSMVAASPEAPLPALGLLLLGYPLQAMGKPERRRDEHFGRLHCPVLFVSGTRDSLAPRAALTRSARKIRGPVTFDWLDTADHGFRPLKRSGSTLDDMLAHVAETCVTWVKSLGEASANTA
jgi:predicted alpha/beta-hydrolase family hydrolase